MTNLYEVLCKYKGQLVICVLVVAIVAQHFLIVNLKSTISNHKCPTVATSETPKVAMDTELKVATKETAESPDLKIDTTYVAEINNRRVEVPIKTTPKATNGATNVTTEVKQTIDVSELVKPMIPKWEVGTGIGVHDSKVYVPVSIQRNYKVDKALEVELQFTDNGLRGASVVHKWRF